MPVLTGMRIAHGGTVWTDVHGDMDCFEKCSADPNCLAFDVTALETTCVMHDVSSACGPLVPGSGTTHHKFINCRKYRF